MSLPAIIYHNISSEGQAMSKNVTIESKMNKMSLTVSEGEYKTRLGDLIVGNFYGGLKQQWVLMLEGDNFVIKSVMNNNVLDVENGSSSIYSNILCYKYHGNHNQLWKIRPYEKHVNTHYIENVKSGLVLEIEGGIDHEGMRVVQNKFYGNLNQLWSINQVKNENRTDRRI